MAKGIEIERKFKVNAYPRNLGAGVQILQGYVEINPDGSEIRVRNKGAEYYFAIKYGRNGPQREEAETPITEATFNALWPLTLGKRIEKTRHFVEVDRRVAELDIYSAALLGLSIVEVEFATLKEARYFVPPAWFTEEVTSDDRYLNQNLARYGLPR